MTNNQRQSDPRQQSGTARKKARERVAAMGLPCAICGRDIDYELTTYIDPSDGKEKPHPMKYELDEILPVSRYRESIVSPYDGEPIGPYRTKQECALDPRNHRPTHRICNQRRGNKIDGGYCDPLQPADPWPVSRAW